MDAGQRQQPPDESHEPQAVPEALSASADRPDTNAHPWPFQGNQGAEQQ